MTMSALPSPTTLERAVTSPLRHLEPRAVDAAARIESRNREVHLPPVSTYRWWARRTEAVNGAVLDAIAKDQPTKLLVADLFAGGGVIPLAAAIRGHRVYAQDLNPWAARGLKAMLNLPTAEAVENASNALRRAMAPVLAEAYGTRWSTGEEATVSHTFRVATADCPGCGYRLRLFPHAMVSLKTRRERGRTEAFVACPKGHLYEASCDRVSTCPSCGETTDPTRSYTSRRSVTCVECAWTGSLEELALSGTWRWDTVLVERARGRRRELALPTECELSAANRVWSTTRELSAIPPGRETAVLRRHGFAHWHDLYPSRQRHILERLLEEIAEGGFQSDVKEALRWACLGVTEMAGLASRWDRFYLKSYEAMASHRFNFTTFSAEPNVWGTSASGRGTFRRRAAAFSKAARWLDERVGKLRVRSRRASGKRAPFPKDADVLVVEGSSERVALPNSTVDIILTDPPYHDDVQYGELSLPLRAWAGMPTGELVAEAVANGGGEAAYAAYRELLAGIFREARRALSPTGHLVFSYANRDVEAWIAVLSALHDAGFRACGYAIVHSENETDLSKRNVRACTMDLILDMVPSTTPVDAWRPPTAPDSPEGCFLRLVGDTLLSSVGQGDASWVGSFRAAAEGYAFVAKPVKRRTRRTR